MPADLRTRRDEAGDELRILGSTLEDVGGDAGRAYAIANDVRLATPSLDDLAGYESWCREVAAAAADEGRAAELGADRG